MEGENSASCKQEKKNTIVFNGGGVGIGGVLVIGGALATAAVIAFFANRNGRRSMEKNDRSKSSDASSNKFDLKNRNESDKEIDGLQLVVQSSTPSGFVHQCCKVHGNSEPESNQIGQDELISTPNSILEATSVLEINGGKEILKNGDYVESYLSDLSNDVEEDPQLEVKKKNEAIIVEHLEDNAKKINVEEEEEEPPLMEAIKKWKSEIEEVVEENSPLKPIEEEDDDYEADDDEEDEENDKGSDSSIDSNTEAICPTNSIKKLPFDLKENKVNYDNSQKEIEEEDETAKNYPSTIDIRNVKLLAMENDQPARRGNNLQMFILLILGAVLLLVMLGFFTHYEPMFTNLISRDLKF